MAWPLSAEQRLDELPFWSTEAKHMQITHCVHCLPFWPLLYLQYKTAIMRSFIKGPVSRPAV
jgi:hypothetical protein